MSSATQDIQTGHSRAGSDAPFYVILSVIGGTYVLLIVALLAADVAYMAGSPPKVIPAEWIAYVPPMAIVDPILAALAKPEIRYSIQLSLISCSMTAILSLIIAVPIGYLLSRHQFFGRNLIDQVIFQARPRRGIGEALARACWCLVCARRQRL